MGTTSPVKGAQSHTHDYDDDDDDDDDDIYDDRYTEDMMVSVTRMDATSTAGGWVGGSLSLSLSFIMGERLIISIIQLLECIFPPRHRKKLPDLPCKIYIF